MNIKDQLAEKADRVRALSNAAIKAGRDFTDEEYAEVERLVPEIEELSAKIKKADELNGVIKSLALPTDDDRRPDWAARGKADGSAWAKSVVKTLASTPLGAKALLTAPIQTSPQFVVPLPQQPTSLLDLIPRVPVGGEPNFSTQGGNVDTHPTITSGNTVSWLRQTIRTNNAATVADGSTKPTSVYTFEEVEDRFRVVAHLTEPIPVRYLGDYPTLVGVLDGELTYGLQREIERLIVGGDHTTAGKDEWDGILHTTGVTDVAFDTDMLTTCRKARTALSDIGVVPTAWVFNPADLEVIDLLRENTGGAGTGGFLVNSAAADTIFGPGVRRIGSPAVAQGTALLANWSTAVQLLVREDASNIVATQHGDLFAKNQVIVRSEGRFLGAVARPADIAVVSLAAAG